MTYCIRGGPLNLAPKGGPLNLAPLKTASLSYSPIQNDFCYTKNNFQRRKAHAKHRCAARTVLFCTTRPPKRSAILRLYAGDGLFLAEHIWFGFLRFLWKS